MIKEMELNLGKLEPLELPDGDPYYPPGYYGGLFYPQGFYLAQAVSWRPSPSAKVELNIGDTLRIYLTFQYRGPAATREFYAACGTNKTSGSFDEWSGGYTARTNITLPQYTSFTTISGKYIDILMPTDPFLWFDHSGEDGAVYVKIMNGISYTEGINITPYYYNAFHLVEAGGEFQSFAISSIAKA